MQNWQHFFSWLLLVLPGSLLGLWTMCFAFVHPFWFTLSIGPLLELHLAFWASASSLKLPVYVGVWVVALLVSGRYFFTREVFYTGEKKYEGNDLYVTLSTRGRDPFVPEPHFMRWALGLWAPLLHHRRDGVPA